MEKRPRPTPRPDWVADSSLFVVHGSRERDRGKAHPSKVGSDSTSDSAQPPLATSLAHCRRCRPLFGPRHAPSDVSIPSGNRTGKSDTRDEPTPTQLYWELQY